MHVVVFRGVIPDFAHRQMLYYLYRNFCAISYAQCKNI